MTAVLREETADDLGLVGEGVGGHQANEGSEGREDCSRELRVVGLGEKTTERSARNSVACSSD